MNVVTVNDSFTYSASKDRGFPKVGSDPKVGNEPTVGHVVAKKERIGNG